MKNFKVLYLVEVGLCVEIRCAFKVVIRVKHPSPTINDILISAQGSTSFSKLCLKSGFHQLESSLASSSLTVFQTEKKKNVARYLFLEYILPKRNYIICPQRNADISRVESTADDILVNFKKRFYCN